MKQLLQSLQKIGRFTAEELERITGRMCERRLQSGSFLLQEGQTCSGLSFVVEGSLLQYRLGEELDQEVLGLYLPGHWVFDRESFMSRRASQNYIAAFAEVQLLELTIHELHLLIDTSPNFLQLGRIFSDSINNSILPDPRKSPDDRYLQLLENAPELITTFPQKLIASYLGMTPETLSRVRKRIQDRT